MASESNTAAPKEPFPIRRLEESLINRIAAGEIIHRPASALKELIENSLDAGSTTIRVTVKDGGMKLLQIQDNGCGIRKSDLPILAQRFTTSKLSTFSDLSKLTTYGFRGEALASISHVAHLQVITKTKKDGCAWKVHYSDGVLVPAKSGQTSDPKPTAGNNGTTITVEDLFYNTPTRLTALRSSSEEYTRILDVVTKYSVHNPHVSFICKKAGSSSADISTPGGESSSKQVVGLLYGSNVSRELIEVKVIPEEKADRMATDEEPPDDHEGDGTEDQLPEPSAEAPWSCEALISNSNYQAKKTVLLLFINHRLVDSARIKKACDGVYSSILPKGTFPYLYLSLEINPRNIDVNVHPTKREVHFLNEDEIIEKLAEKMAQALVKVTSSRVFEYQTLLTGGIAEDPKSKYRNPEHRSNSIIGGSTVSVQSQSGKKTASQHKVRQSEQDRTLESMFPVSNPAHQVREPAIVDVDAEKENEDQGATANDNIRDIQETTCYLTSVLNLRKEVEGLKHNRLTEILERHVFVGIVDLSKCLSLVQHLTKLYLVNHAALAEEFFYQLGLRQFGNLPRLKLEPPPTIKELIRLAVEVEEGIEKAGVPVDDVVSAITGILQSKRDMLDEYFSMKIDDNGELINLPLLLKGYTPNLDKLPLFLMRLGPQVDWKSEKECFATFLRELAYFYVPGPFVPNSEEQDDVESTTEQEKAERWQIQHVLFPTMRRYLVATKGLLDKDVVQIASLPDLYRVFERC